MDQGEAYAAGGFWTDSGGFVNELLVIPKFTDHATNKPYSAKAGPVVVLDYGIIQQPGGTGICVALFESTALPVNGSAMFPGGAGNPKRIFPLTGGTGVILSLSAPWHRYDTGLAIVVSTSYATVTRASAATFIAVRTAQAYIGGPPLPAGGVEGGAYPQG